MAYFTKTRAGKKEGSYRTSDYRIGNQPHMAKFKIVRNVRQFTLYSIDSNIQDELLVKMVSKSWCFATLMEEDLQKIIDNMDLWGKIFMRYSKTNTMWFISRSSKITGPLVLDAWDYFPPLRVGKKSHASNTSRPVIFTTSLNTMLYLYIIFIWGKESKAILTTFWNIDKNTSHFYGLGFLTFQCYISGKGEGRTRNKPLCIIYRLHWYFHLPAYLCLIIPDNKL